MWCHIGSLSLSPNQIKVDTNNIFENIQYNQKVRIVDPTIFSAIFDIKVWQVPVRGKSKNWLGSKL
jgi:hypothetical protein